MKIKDIYNYQSTHGELSKPVKTISNATLEKEVQEKLGFDLFEEYMELVTDNEDIKCELAYKQGFKDGAALIKEILN